MPGGRNKGPPSPCIREMWSIDPVEARKKMWQGSEFLDEVAAEGPRPDWGATIAPDGDLLSSIGTRKKGGASTRTDEGRREPGIFALPWERGRRPRSRQAEQPGSPT